MKSKLQQLLRDNRGAAKALAPASRIVQAADSKEATLYIYDAIVSSEWEAEYWGGVCPQQIVPQLLALDAQVINLRINSPGGDVFAAQAICTALKQHKAKVIAHIDGVAASAATSIACACDEVVMADGAMYMIHNAWTIAMGDRNDFLETASCSKRSTGCWPTPTPRAPARARTKWPP
jgi:ATP-dependent Clp protease protease subunit